MVREEVNKGILTKEQVDALDIELYEFMQEVERHGGELYYQLKKNNKGEIILVLEGDSDYWNYKEIKGGE